ncbi:uncharacterized protein LOC125944811 [Dermacentor silvarum]|uniref:uncharacterized protein LOC125944811 n=1 Tax=Dermacentor silvarum TaxID=543639 RepID=UPI0021016D98|nr:uncharacterized protein LOC125944811 [Dermacentor silvarum]
MSDEAEEVKKRCEIALAVATIASMDVELEAARAKVRTIKRHLVINSLMLNAAVLSGRRATRQVWAYPRCARWFEETLPNLGGQNFRQSFRVSKTTFKYLVDVCRPVMQRQTTNMREMVSLEKRVAVALYKLCSSAEDRTVANLFDLGRSTGNTIYREFCQTVVDALEKQWVKMIAANEMADHVREFCAVTGFPQAVGALDGCHFPVSPPKENAIDYYNYKGWYSVILLALVDHKYRFRYTNVGSPGRYHNAHVFHNSILARAIQEPAFQSPTICVGTSLVPPLILCDQAFPLTSNLMKPFPGTNHTPEESNFNYELSKTRRIVENAFGRLKARFRFVMKRMECDISNVPIVVRACCVLNNICEHFNDSASQQWLNEAELQNTVYQQPLHTTGTQVGCGRDVRDAVVHYFQLHGDHCSRVQL